MRWYKAKNPQFYWSPGAVFHILFEPWPKLGHWIFLAFVGVRKTDMCNINNKHTCLKFIMHVIVSWSTQNSLVSWETLASRLHKLFSCLSGQCTSTLSWQTALSGHVMLDFRLCSALWEWQTFYAQFLLLQNAITSCINARVAIQQSLNWIMQVWLKQARNAFCITVMAIIPLYDSRH
jgi:hypothetical protein